MKQSDVLREIRRHGGVVKQGTKHLKVFTPDGRMVCVIPHKPNNFDQSTARKRNMISTLRAAGLWDE